MDYEKGLRESGNYSEMEIQKLLLDNKIIRYKINYAPHKIPHNLSQKEQKKEYYKKLKYDRSTANPNINF